MTEPNKELLSDPEIPTVEIFGKAWPIPKLAIAQLRIVGPIFVARAKGLLEINAEAIDDAAMVLFWGLRRGHPELTREEFDAMAIDLPGLMLGWRVVAQQSGLFKPAKAGDQVPLDPTAAPSSPTG